MSCVHAVARAIEADKLFHIDLNDQKPGRFDQDLRFGSESIKSQFFVVKLLEDSGYDGARHFELLARAQAVKAQTFDRAANRRLAYERLDQLVIDLLLGA